MKLNIILIFLSFSCFGQVNDSLLFQLKSIENDTERVNQLYKTGFNLRNEDPEMAYQYAVICEQEALKSNSIIHLAKSYNLLGVIFYKKGDYTNALKFQNKSLQLNKSIINEFGIAINHANIGNIYSDINCPKLAEISYLQSLQASNKTNNTLQITRCLINIGTLKYNQKQLKAAVKQFEEALNYANIISNHELIASCYNNIGTIMREQNQLDSALMYLEEGLKIRQLIDDEFELADSYNNIAMVYILQKNFSQASNFINLASEICEKYDYPEALVELYHTRSVFFETQQNFEQANIWLKKHYNLKDSLEKIEKENNASQFFIEDSINQNPVISIKPSQNIWLLISFIIMLIGIPLFLIRFKR
jgi:tetratricopeptide (TPR) repeat protein